MRDEPDPPTAEDVADLVDCLAGTAIPQQHLVAWLAEREAACELLTRDQARVLDMLAAFSRVEIRGGAGSGKTWLAVEKARRLAAEGKRVALMCYSRGLAEFLKRRVEGLPKRQRPDYVGTFHNLGIGWGVPPGSDDDSGYWEEFLPARMVSLAADLPPEQRFDAIVIDEGQDFADSWWDAVLAALRDPDAGSLYVFADEGQRVFARQGRPSVDLVPIPLTENLRNTKQIAGTFSSLAPEQMRIRGLPGVPVRFVQCSPEDAVDVADGVASALLEEEDWPPEAVALLTTHRRHPVQVERQSGGQDAYWATYWEDDDLFYGHVLGFKGLERPAVVLAVNGFRDEARAREMLYVGLSRARDLLVVCGDLEQIRRVGGEAVARRLSP
ncbi:ATP-binding domain-containing protein [Geodermatophilus sp. SYSU D00697]